jgi:1,4-dihydroxy-2-naphthoate polyprenyltransferase
VLSFLSGVSLMLVSHIHLFSVSFFVLLVLGLIAIWAALTYTIGKNPYGYSGWGDLSVFIFFGLFSVTGTYMLYAGTFNPDVFLPAISVGAFSVGVLNINNMRDIENDKMTGKKTLVVMMGPVMAKYYHFFLLIIAMVSSVAYIMIDHIGVAGYLFLIVLVPMTIHVRKIIKIEDAALFDKELKKLALTALLFAVVFGIGINI